MSLRGIPGEETFNQASVSTEERNNLREGIASQIRDAMLAAYTVTEIEYEPEQPKAVETNGWKGQESTQSGEAPRHKWRQMRSMISRLDLRR